jgi:hypothetical protein
VMPVYAHHERSTQSRTGMGLALGRPGELREDGGPRVKPSRRRPWLRLLERK